MSLSSQLQLCYLFFNELNHILYPQVTQDTQRHTTPCIINKGGIAYLKLILIFYIIAL